MSDIPVDFVSATKRILAKVASILTHIEIVEGDVKLIREQVVSNADKPRTHTQAGDSEQKRLDSISTSDATQAEGKNYNADHSKNDVHQFLDNQRRRWLSQIRKPKFQVALITLVFLVFYTCGTRTANKLTQQSLDNVRDQMRPYVFTDPATFPPPGMNIDVWARQSFDEQLLHTHTLGVNVSVINYGTSMAKLTSAGPPQVAIGEDALQTAKVCDVKRQESDQIVPPQGSAPTKRFVLEVARTRILSAEEIGKLENKDSNFKVVWFGKINYTSLRGGDYSTEYCYVYVPSGMPIGHCGVGICSEFK